MQDRFLLNQNLPYLYALPWRAGKPIPSQLKFFRFTRNHRRTRQTCLRTFQTPHRQTRPRPYRNRGLHHFQCNPRRHRLPRNNPGYSPSHKPRT